MLSLNFLLLVIASSLSIIHASRYCQCENPTYGRIFPGIQSICSELSSGWCATNCNIAGYNCDYCQWTPAGAEPQADYQKLKTWCSQQQGYDSNSQQSYHGTEVNCYSNNGKASCSTCGGCSYSSTSFYRRDLLDEVLTKRQGSDEDTDSSPQSSVLLEEESLLGVNEGGIECSLLFPTAAEEIKDSFIHSHPDCKSTGSSEGRYSITCGGLVNDAEGLLGGLLGGDPPASDTSSTDEDDFSQLCDDYGGHAAKVDGQGKPLTIHSPS